MNEIRFENAFGDVPPAVHARVAAALRDVKTVKRAKPAAAILLAALLALALAGAAYAAVRSGVLAFLFTGGEPTESQEAMVQAVGLGRTDGGVTTTLTDAVFDGRELSVGLQFATDRNLFVVIDRVTINGVDAYLTNSDLGDLWLANPFDTCGGVYTGGLTATLAQAFFDPEDQAALEAAYAAIAQSGRAEVCIGLTLLVPKGRLTAVDTNSGDAAAMWQAIDGAVAAGDTPVSLEEPYEVLTGSAALGDDFTDDLPAQHPVGDALAYETFANMTALDSFTLDFSLDAGGEAAVRAEIKTTG